jgi:hypothetical protein
MAGRYHVPTFKLRTRMEVREHAWLAGHPRPGTTTMFAHACMYTVSTTTTQSDILLAIIIGTTDDLHPRKKEVNTHSTTCKK